MMIMLIFIAQGITGGAFGEQRMRDVGMVLMPSVNEQHFQGKVQYLLNSTSEAQEQVQKLNGNIHNFAETSVAEALTWLTCFMMCVSMFGNIMTSLRKSHFGYAHIMQGLSPIITLLVFNYLVFNYT